MFGRLAWAPRDSYFPGFSRITVEHKGSTCPPSLATFSRITIEHKGILIFSQIILQIFFLKFKGIFLQIFLYRFFKGIFLADFFTYF